MGARRVWRPVRVVVRGCGDDGGGSVGGGVVAGSEIADGDAESGLTGLDRMGGAEAALSMLWTSKLLR